MTTKICENCLSEIHSIIQFRELCASTDFRIRSLMECPIGNDNNYFGVIGSEESTLAATDEMLDDENAEIVFTPKWRRTDDLDSSNLES